MKKVIEVHGIPMDLGANLRGVDMGPSALRIARITTALSDLGHDVRDLGEIPVKSRVSQEDDKGNARFVAAVGEACERIATVAERAVKRGAIPIFLGGDHSIATGTVSGVATALRASGESLGLIWFDAHTDMNTPETSPSGNVHGMPLASLLGIGDERLTNVAGWSKKVQAKNVCVIGARQVDENEKALVAESGITVFSMKEVDYLGMAEVARQAVEIASEGTGGVHLSFDIDGLDPTVAPGVGTPVLGGISFREAHLLMELVADSGRLRALDVVELNPVRDLRNATAEVVVHLVQSAFGQSIL